MTNLTIETELKTTKSVTLRTSVKIQAVGSVPAPDEPYGSAGWHFRWSTSLCIFRLIRFSSAGNEELIVPSLYHNPDLTSNH